ncbi:MAG: hypothetical protein ACLQJR_17095 [Stellaceae bacterium]
MIVMTQKLKKLMARIETWPEAAQEELMRSAFDIEMRYVGGYTLTEEDRAALERSSDDARHGRFASDEEVAELFGRFRHA